MDVPAWERMLATHAPTLVVGLGVAVAGVSVANFLADVETLGFGLVPLLALGLCLTMSAGLFGLGRWLSTCGLSTEETWSVVRWCLGGMVGFVALSSLTVGLRLLEGRAVGEAALGVIVVGAGGGIGGGVAGIYYARANRAVREADHRRDALVFLNSHLRHNVLNATQVIQGYTTLLDERDDVADEYLVPIERRSDAIASLIEDVKRLSDVFSGEHTPSPTDVSTVVLRAVEDVREDHPEATFEVDVQPELYVMATDAASAVFANLLQNAVQHHDRSDPTVRVSAERAGRTVSVSIADDGPGIRDDVKDHLFESAIESGEGRGIALVKTLMNHYGGGVEVRDNDPRGTEVVVEFRRPPRRL
ncbi:ATP-binding protein [Haloplanus pelagicus]|jgi:signal transduction histidine kinase|uniref:ATP-binding protein n=1 Tax=Haloplanus pelagicus TaxID=2949995 RepID=UPI00203C8A91|nr:ATP-binding protein [Haloplanus sp. HW8-1]